MSDNSADFSLQRLSLEWLSAAVANGFASAVLNPMDVSKTRMQAELSKSKGNHPHGLAATLRILYNENGIIGLWKPGLNASLARELLYSGPRAGFYVPLRNHIYAKIGFESELPSKVLAALTTGTFGAIVANPVDVAKIRLMVNPTLYPTVTSAVSSIYRAEGFKGLYRGLLPSTLRGAFIAVGELATYDQSKTLVKQYFNVSEGFGLHTICSLITGLVATTVAAPFDLLKTRAMNATLKNEERKMLNMIRVVLKEEGLMIFFRGWLPAYLRLGPHALICFPVFEQLRRLLGLEYI
eukprot:gene2843-3027_t